MMDVVITTTQNDKWLQRALITLVTHTNPATLGKIVVMGDVPLSLGCAEGLREQIVIDASSKRRSWRENTIESLKHTTSPLVMYMHDDAMVTPGNPDWLSIMAEPFARDPLVAAVSCVTNDSAGCPQTHYENCFMTGEYYTTWFTPIFVLARPQEWVDVVRETPEDMFGDYIPCLELCRRGWKVVVTNRVCNYHKGQQSNLRVYGGQDVDGWLKDCRKRVQEYMATAYSPVWLARINSCEMVPMQNFHAPKEGGSEVVMI